MSPMDGADPPGAADGKGSTAGPDAGARHKSRGGPMRLIPALRYSLFGLLTAFRNEAAFRQELLLAALLFPLVWVIPASLTQRALLIASLFLVLITELLNSAVEAVVDRMSPETHELARRAKDLGSAAVFLSLLACAAVWVTVLVELYA